MVKYDYDFDPAVDYQPKPKADVVHLWGGATMEADGSVHVSNTCLFKLLHDLNNKGYNNWEINGCPVTPPVYKQAAKQLWPEKPAELSWVDHIDRNRTNDAFDNLRWVNASLNNLNQYRRKTKGYYHETQEWLDSVNEIRAKKKQRPLVLTHKPREKYIAAVTYKGTSHELGAFETPEAATKCYNKRKEGFIQERLRDLWSEFLFA